MSTAEFYNSAESDAEDGHEVPIGDMNKLISAAEVNQQIATAKRYPRSISKFLKEALELVTLNTSVAEQCTYVLKRGGKTIEGPSVRFAEIINACWGNIRSAARVVEYGEEYVTAEGICYDLEKNNAIRFEVPRRITDKEGVRYNSDMIGVTANAASSIALRNAILKVVPKAFWQELWEEAKKVARGDEKTFGSRRHNVLSTFKELGVTPQQIYDLLGIGGLDDLTRDHMVTLTAILTAIRDGDTTVENQFGAPHKAERGNGGQLIVHNGRRNEFERHGAATQAAPRQAPEPVREAEPQRAAATAPQQKPVAAPEPERAVETAPASDLALEPAPSKQAEAQQPSKDESLANVFDDWFRDRVAEIPICRTPGDVADLWEAVIPNLDDAQAEAFEGLVFERLDTFLRDAKGMKDIVAVRGAVDGRMTGTTAEAFLKSCDARGRELLAQAGKGRGGKK